jgi:hypothetical protein
MVMDPYETPCPDCGHAAEEHSASQGCIAVDVFVDFLGGGQMLTDDCACSRLASQIVCQP